MFFVALQTNVGKKEGNIFSVLTVKGKIWWTKHSK